jgi:hypothetical protein
VRLPHRNVITKNPCTDILDVKAQAHLAYPLVFTQMLQQRLPHTLAMTGWHPEALVSIAYSEKHLAHSEKHLAYSEKHSTYNKRKEIVT